jgi:hypothetical protein|tara:strand:- start:348 stop:725 length:378 start_codon:yes stop_codon:yes gene_type:complete
MPYIPQDERKELDDLAGALTTQLRNGNFRGRLNYFISSVAQGLIEANGVSYSFLNDFIGVLECVKLELYRRVATPYEDEKMGQNGDVFVTLSKQASELEKKLSKDKVNLQDFDYKTDLSDKWHWD